MFPIVDGIDPDVPVLTGGQDVLASDIHLHIVESRLANHVVAARELGQAPLVASHIPKDDGLIGAATDHLQLMLGRRRVPQEPDCRDAARMIV